MQEHLKEMLEEIKSGGAQLLDVREVHEWEEGHLKLAHLVPLSTLDNGEEPKEINKETKTYLHCRSGARVQRAAPLLQGLGFNNVIPLSEGFDELVDEGLEPA